MWVICIRQNSNMFQVTKWPCHFWEFASKPRTNLHNSIYSHHLTAFQCVNKEKRSYILIVFDVNMSVFCFAFHRSCKHKNNRVSMSNFRVLKDCGRNKVQTFSLYGDQFVYHFRGATVKMFRLLFVLALTLFLSSFGESTHNKSANQVTIVTKCQSFFALYWFSWKLRNSIFLVLYLLVVF